MTKLKQIQAEIEALSHDEYAELRRWFAEKDRQKWDEQIKADSDAGKLDFLIEEAKMNRQKKS